MNGEGSTTEKKQKNKLAIVVNLCKSGLGGHEKQ